jgi:hypothetical protein
VLKKVLQPKKEEVTGGCPELHDEELKDLYSTSNIFWVAVVALYSENSVTFQSTKQLTPQPPSVQTSRTIAGEQF